MFSLNRNINLAIVVLFSITLTTLIQSCSLTGGSSLYVDNETKVKDIKIEKIAVLFTNKPLPISNQTAFLTSAWMKMNETLNHYQYETVSFVDVSLTLQNFNYRFNTDPNLYKDIAAKLECDYLILPEYQINSGSLSNPLFNNSEYYAAVQLKLFSVEQNKFIATMEGNASQYNSNGIATLIGGVAASFIPAESVYSGTGYGSYMGLGLLAGILIDFLMNVQGKSSKWEATMDRAIELAVWNFVSHNQEIQTPTKSRRRR